MSGIYWTDEHGRLKSYSAAVKGTKAVLKIELEVFDHFELGSLLSNLERLELEQSTIKKTPWNPQPKGRAERLRQQVESQQRLLLTDQREP